MADIKDRAVQPEKEVHALPPKRIMDMQHKVTVLLTTWGGLMQNVIYLRSLGSYTHASISIDPDLQEYYSFNYKGFAIEHPTHWHHRVKNSQIYVLDCTEEEYNQIKEIIEKFKENRDSLSFSKRKLFWIMFSVSYKKRQEYICSEFVSILLRNSGVIEDDSFAPERTFPARLDKILKNHKRTVFAYHNPLIAAPKESPFAFIRNFFNTGGSDIEAMKRKQAEEAAAKAKADADTEKPTPKESAE